MVMVGQEIKQVFMQKEPSEGFFENGYVKNFVEFTTKKKTTKKTSVSESVF